MSTKRNPVLLFLLTVIVMALPSVAVANPIDNLVSSIKGYVDTFTNVLIPIFCVAALAWCGFGIATDRKTYTDLIKVLVGCVVAVAASQIISYITKGTVVP